MIFLKIILNQRNLISSKLYLFKQFKVSNELSFLKSSVLKNNLNKNFFSTKPNQNLNDKSKSSKSKDLALYGFAVVLITLSFTYASVPLYRIYCQATGKGGRAKVSDDYLANKIKSMKKVDDKLINVVFTADKESKMRWNFKPTQSEVKVYPGETALAFFTAKNPTNVSINGVSTYSVVPIEAGQYLNKIQCFCFEEQRLDPGEEVDMPVFFYFDPEFTEDPKLENCNEVVLSYTFFEAKEGIKLPSFPSPFKKQVEIVS